jgi:hypothetical protein
MTGPGKARRGDHRPVSFRGAGAVAEHEHRPCARPRAAATLTISASAVGRYPPSDVSCLETRYSRRHVIDNQPGKYDNQRKV